MQNRRAGSRRSRRSRGAGRSAYCLVASQIVEKEIAGLVAQHLVPDLPVQILVGRRVEQLLDPCREQGLVRAIPAVAHLPDVWRWNPQGLRLACADNDVASEAAIRRATVAPQRRVPGAGG